MDKLDTLIACLPDAPFKTNLVEELTALRAEVASLTGYNKTRTDERIAAGKQVAAQQAQMYADRKQALVWMDQVAVLTKELDGAKTLAIYYCEQLAAAQAREAKLLEALAMIHLMGMHQNDRTTAQEALALHADDSALQARLKEERERCAEFCEAYDKYDYAVTGRKTLADAIRGLA